MSGDNPFAGTMPVREKHAFDVARLETYMAAEVAGFTPPLSVEQFKGGQSNPTYRLTDSAGKAYALRRKPPGKLLKSAHAVDREYRVMTALAETAVPVPRTYALCTDEAVIGTWFYIMDCVDGRIFWDITLPELTSAERREVFDAMNTTIAALHQVDFATVGLGDFGKPGNYFARQIARWGSQYQNDEEAGRFDAMDRLVDWLPEHIPPGDETSIVHGDFRLDNMIFAPDRLEVAAVLDWELSTLGHPLADFSYHLMMYRMPASGFNGLAGVDIAALGIPSEEAYVAAYCARTGRDGIPHLDFYFVYNLFRIAAILHGILGRVKRGTASSKQAAERGAMTGPLADLAWSYAEKIK